jgi:type I restriction-modification system DNA methylase subunit
VHGLKPSHALSQKGGGMKRDTPKTQSSTASKEHQERKAFIAVFNTIARQRHRYEVFKDFVTMAAISLHNATNKDEALEAEYMSIVKRYTKEEALLLSQLLSMLVNMLEPAPRDVLGTLFMELDFGGTHNGQFFTPYHISELMALIAYGDDLEKFEAPFITLCEPACGAGGMVLAFVGVMIDKGHNPAKRLWVQCQDIDRTAALMCYLQLSLWHVPGVVIVGNTLANEQLEQFYTPAHFLEGWRWKLKRKWQDREGWREESQDEEVKTSEDAAGQPAPKLSVPLTKPTLQVDFGF